MQLAEIVSLYIRWSYTGALSPLFPFSLGFRNHCHEYSVLIPIQTSMNLPMIPTTAAGTMPLVQTPRGRSTVLAILDLLVMDTSAKVKSYTSHFTPLSPYDVCISTGVSTLCQHRASRISQQLMGFISDIGEGVKNTSDSSNENATCKNSEGSSKSTCKLVFSGSGHNCTNNEFSRWKNPKYILLSVVEVRLMIRKYFILFNPWVKELCFLNLISRRCCHFEQFLKIYYSIYICIYFFYYYYSLPKIMVAHIIVLILSQT